MLKRPTRYANHPIIKYVRSMPEPLYLPREVAQQLNVAARSLRYAQQHSEAALGPTHKAQYGATVLHLYTPQRIEQLRAYFDRNDTPGQKAVRRGPPKLWTQTETASRRRRFDQARKYSFRAVDYDSAGNTAMAEKMRGKAAATLAQLEKQRLERRDYAYGKRAKNSPLAQPR